MAFNNIDQLQLGNLLQIVFSDGVRNQISKDYRDWEMVTRNRNSSSQARELRFMFQTSYGPSAIQYRDPGTSGRAFPNAQQATISEHTAKFKEIDATIELEYNMWDRARKSPEKYAEPLALEIQSKTTAAKRRLAADYYADGTGVMAQLAAASATPNPDGTVTFTLDDASSARGFVGWCEFGDLFILRAADSSASALDTNLATEPANWRVERKDREAPSITLRGLDAAGNEVSVASVSVQPTAGDVFYRAGQPTIPDLTSPFADYGTATEVIAGLESLASNDGRVIHGITMSGANSATRRDAGGAPLDVSLIQKVMDDVKVNVGQDSYSWKMMCMAPESHSSFVESRETDRRFHTVEDATRGIRYFAYQHGNDSIETYTSEYCPKSRIWIKPEARATSDKVMEFWGSDFETVKAEGMGDFHLKPGAGGGHVNTVVSYLSSRGVLICKHPAAIAVVENFSL